MLLQIFLISYTEIISTSYELKYSEVLMMINITHLLEVFSMLVKHYHHKKLKISTQSNPSLGKTWTE